MQYEIAVTYAVGGLVLPNIIVPDTEAMHKLVVELEKDPSVQSYTVYFIPLKSFESRSMHNVRSDVYICKWKYPMKEF